MDSQNKNPLLSLGNISPTIALILLALGPIFRSGGIVSSRPTVDPMLAPMVPGEVPARLWEDPFQAVLNYVDAWKKSDGEGAAFVLKGIGATLPDTDLKKDRIDPQVILKQFSRVVDRGDSEARMTFVLMAGANGHRENGERMTTRTAVGQGILAHGGSIQSGKLPFLTFPEGNYFKSDFKGAWPDFPSGRWGTPSDRLFALKHPFFIPYDRFRVERSRSGNSEAPAYDHFVYYIDIDRLGADWLGTLSGLRRGIEAEVRKRMAAKDVSEFKLNFSCIGPGFSDHLIQALAKAKARSADQTISNTVLDALPPIYSPFATMDAALMYEAVGEKIPADPEGSLVKDLGQLGWRLERTTSTDSELMLLLLREIGYRFPFHRNHLHAVIFAESNSAYGTSWLPKEEEKADEEADPCAEGFTKLWREIIDKYGEQYDLPEIHVTGGIRFWRGLDGSGLWHGGGGLDKASNGGGEDNTGYPAGSSQVDYLGRYIAEQKASYSNFSDQNMNLDLVGIFGIDPYDRLMLVRGAKESFPHAMYFGADLDARYFHQKDLAVTRNMLFVAHYGLELPGELQKNLPPFRDSYQTATYFATLKMLNDIGCLTNSESAGLEKYSQSPRLFEIGNGRAVELKLPDASCSTPAPDLLRAPPTPSFFRIALLVVGVLAGIGFVDRFVLGNRMAQRWRKLNENGAWAKKAWVYLFGAVLLMVVAVHWSVNGGEPLSATNGVSAWPTQFIRYLCIGMTLWMIGDMRKRFADCTKGIGEIWPFHKKGFWIQEYMQTTPLSSAWEEIGLRHIEETENRECWKGTVLLTFIYLCLIWFFGWVGNQTRGAGMEIVNLTLALASNAAFAFLFCMTLRYFQSFNTLIHRLVTKELPEKEFPRERFDYEKVLNYYRFELKLVTRIGDRVYGFIYYPAVILLLLGLARSTYFDAWVWPISLVIALPIVFCALLMAGILIRREAARFRRQRLVAYSELERQFGNSDCAGLNRPDLAESCREIADELRGLDRGVFASILNDPILKAMLVPLSGFGALAMLEEGITFM